MSQDPYKSDGAGADPTAVPDAEHTSDMVTSSRLLIDVLVDELPDVRGAVVSSVDGFVISARLPAGLDVASIAAMSAATLGLTSRLVQLVGSPRPAFSHHASATGHVFVFAVPGGAVLTVLTGPEADPARIVMVCGEVVSALARLGTS
jgi:predicted regulator of Ras-like GTPase activity (Roadblock/LC7/MglB family)